ncbi:glycosyl transferase [Paenibacillus doosanensis]|uniref:glycosyltransferase family 32 protein n=1 Tax=Paenibacillus doosanensis TaxID=1229154 RepID=UPI0021807EBC|nr:glycosyltransferase [Paenibacillus doosanensis]MCS7461029.1 glycosyl transferase [Paenibacillus doosanensis]
MNSGKAEIPRVIHYCWFGKGKKNQIIVNCMKSWAKHLKPYEIVEWNEDNFDIASNLYVKQAYEAGKYAFVSDYVRLYALYHHGGIYMDTDVEVLKSLDRFRHHEAFSGFEDEQHVPTGIMGAVQGHPWIQELLDHYKDIRFLQPDGSLDLTTNTRVITDHCLNNGLVLNNQYQVLRNGVALYPRTYFCPYDYINGANYITDDSYTIHHFAKSWLPAHVRWRSRVKKSVSKLMGPAMISKLRGIVNRM